MTNTHAPLLDPLDMADITTPQARTRGMARIGAAHNLGTVFGPAMGEIHGKTYRRTKTY